MLRLVLLEQIAEVFHALLLLLSLALHRRARRLLVDVRILAQMARPRGYIHRVGRVCRVA